MARLPIASEYVELERGDELAAAFQFALDLMRGDPRELKAGYRPPAAIATTIEAFNLDRDRAVTLERIVLIHEDEPARKAEVEA
jgi:hypothetical protein